MKLLIQNNRIAGTATDAYTGPDEFMATPEGFDLDKMGDYVVTDGVLTKRIPQAVTMRQARLALLQAGKLSEVAAAIASLSSPQKEEVQIEWDYSQTVERHRPFTGLMAGALGLSGAQTDALFIAAAAL